MKTTFSLPCFLLLFVFPASAQDGATLYQPPRRAEGQSEAHKKIVGYFPQWGIYSNYFVKNVVTSGSAELLTHLSYAFANVVNNQCQSFDTWADYQVPFSTDQTVNGEADSQQSGAFVGNFHQLKELKRRYPGLKIILSIGGASADPAAFSVAAQPENRQAFVASCVSMYILGNFAPGISEPGIFDGIDLDWEFPGPDDKQNFTALLREFRRQLDAVRPGLALTMAASADSWNYQNIELKKVQRYLSFFNLMTYDYDGPWSNQTGFVAPLYQSHFDPDPINNADQSVQGYLQAGVKAEKIVLGIPFYGYEWTSVPDVDRGLFEPGTPEGQGSPYNYIVTIETQFSKFRDPVNKAPWLYDGTTFWTYEDPTSISFKIKYIRHQNLGGVMFWELSNDLPNGLLLRTIAKGLEHDRK
jgi:chitinase